MDGPQQHPLDVLFTHYGDEWVRGSEQVLLDLLAGLDRARVRPVVWCNGTQMTERVRDLGVPVHQTDFINFFDQNSPRFSPRRYVSFVRQGRALAKRYRVKVLHANSAAPVQWLVPVARSLRVPLLAHLHTSYLRRGRFTSLLHPVDLIVGVSSRVTSDFLSDGVTPSRIRVIHNGIDFNRLQSAAPVDFRSMLHLPSSAVVMVAVGSLIRRKGLDVLLQALGRTSPGIDLRLVVAGDGPERAALERLTSDLGLQSRVHFVGYVENTPALYRSGDFTVLASHAEAFGLVLAEAGFFGLPAVASRVGGVPEVVADGVSGLLVPPGDVDALAAALTRLGSDAGYRRTLGDAARERVLREFGLQKMVAAFEDAYSALAALDRRMLGWRGLARSLRPYGRLVGLSRQPTAVRAA